MLLLGGKAIVHFANSGTNSAGPEGLSLRGVPTERRYLYDGAVNWHPK